MPPFLMKELYGILYCIFLGLCCWLAFSQGQAYERMSRISLEQHDLCFDTKTHEAFVAKKNGELRCFLQQKEWPHKVKGYHIEYD